MNKEKVIDIKAYIANTIDQFHREIEFIALENDYPYIEAILESALIRMKENIRWNRADIRKDEWRFTVQGDTRYGKS